MVALPPLRSYIDAMVLRNFGRGRPLNAPAESSDSPTADDFRAVYSVAERTSEDIAAQPPKTETDAERPAPSEDIAAQPPKIMTDFVLLALMPTVIVVLAFIIAFVRVKL